MSLVPLVKYSATIVLPGAGGRRADVGMGSAHGTLLSGKKLPPLKSHILPPGRSLVFGAPIASCAQLVPAANALASRIWQERRTIDTNLQAPRGGHWFRERRRAHGSHLDADQGTARPGDRVLIRGEAVWK